MSKDKKPLKGIQQGSFSRTVRLARFAFSSGAKVAGQAVGNLFVGEEEKAQRQKKLITEQMQLLAQELGQLKGMAMKFGQTLSMYGEHFFPPEANRFLKTLQSQSPPLEWEKIWQVLQEDISAEVLQTLVIDQKPLAAASLGQVHLATRVADGQKIAIKIQYPGIQEAMESDFQTIRNMMKLMRFLPKNIDQPGMFQEIYTMLQQEIDYRQEAQHTLCFSEKLQQDKRYVVPKVFLEYCSERILATSFEEGYSPDSPEILTLPQKRRDALGASLLDLYIKEIFAFRLVQTDPHFGNYRMHLGKDPSTSDETVQDGDVLDRLVLLDFGAVRGVDAFLLETYESILVGIYHEDKQRLMEGAKNLGLLDDKASDKAFENFKELCLLLFEPFLPPEKLNNEAQHLLDDEGCYDWGRSDLATRLAHKVAAMALTLEIKAPKRETMYLNRKFGGIFVFLSVLGCKLNGWQIVRHALPFSLEKPLSEN